MSLGPGLTIGPFKIQSLLGKGGMGEVFSALDTRLGRQVALKILPPDFAADPDRLRRFQSEAKTLASINHPNILVIHEVGAENGNPYLVSELLEGRTLREELANGPLPVRKTTDYALQIANGLAAAHARGIIHRDLKPENIFITKDGRVKILDFGLAKCTLFGETSYASPASPADNEDPGDSHRSSLRTSSAEAPTLLQSTIPGVILGTPAYMAPEQVRGEPADHRSDIFAFGCVLYELLSGRRVFQRDTSVASMNAVLSEDPPEVSATNEKVPPIFARIVERCLAKQPDNRFQSARDLAFALESSGSSQETARLQSVRTRARRSRWRTAWVFGAAAALLVATFAFMAGRLAWQSPGASSVNWHGQRLGGPLVAFRPVASPDGKEVAFTWLDRGMTQVGIMNVDSGNWLTLTTNRALGNAGYLCWSRDGTEIFFDRYISASMGVFRISKYGGEERLILEEGDSPQMLPDDTMLVMRRTTNGLLQLHRYWLGGQRLEPLNAVTRQLEFGIPFRVMPGGKEVIFTGRPANSKSEAESLWALNLQTGACELLNSTLPKRLLEWAASPHSPDPADQSILSVETVGDTYHIVRGARRTYASRRTLLTLTLAPVDLDVGSDGSLYLDQIERPIEILWFSGSNKVDRLPLSASYENPRKLPLAGDRLLLSSRVAGKHRLVVMAPGQDAVPFLPSREQSRGPIALLGRDRVLCRVGDGINWSVAIVSVAGGRVLQLLKSIPADDSLKSLASAPDAKTIYYVAAGGVWSVPVDGGDPRRLRDGNGIAPDPNGQYLLIQVNQQDGTRLVRVPVGGGPETILSPQYPITFLPIAPHAISPDGRVALQIAPTDSWFWRAGILDQTTGQMDLVPEDQADMDAPGWDDRGRLVVTAQFMRSSLWRFRPEK